MTDTHEGYDQAGAPTLHRGLLANCPAPECQDRLAEQQEDDAEPDLTEVQKAYNVAQYELYQLAAYGHCTYTNGELLTAEGKRQQADYNDRIQAAQTRFEAAALAKAAEYFQSVIDSIPHPEDNAYYWNGVQHTVQGLQAQAADLLKEQE